jgi:hypothetical protein
MIAPFNDSLDRSASGRVFFNLNVGFDVVAYRRVQSTQTLRHSRTHEVRTDRKVSAQKKERYYMKKQLLSQSWWAHYVSFPVQKKAPLLIPLIRHRLNHHPWVLRRP